MPLFIGPWPTNRPAFSFWISSVVAAWRRFVSCVQALPPDHATPLWQVVSAEATARITARANSKAALDRGDPFWLVNLGRATRFKFLLHLLGDSPSVEIVFRPSLSSNAGFKRTFELD
jgi:hypothetical protein